MCVSVCVPHPQLLGHCNTIPVEYCTFERSKVGIGRILSLVLDKRKVVASGKERVFDPWQTLHYYKQIPEAGLVKSGQALNAGETLPRRIHSLHGDVHNGSWLIDNDWNARRFWTAEKPASTNADGRQQRRAIGTECRAWGFLERSCAIAWHRSRSTESVWSRNSVLSWRS